MIEAHARTKRRVRCHTCGKETMPPVKEKIYHEDGNRLVRIYLCNECIEKIDWI